MQPNPPHTNNRVAGRAFSRDVIVIALVLLFEHCGLSVTMGMARKSAPSRLGVCFEKVCPEKSGISNFYVVCGV